MKNNDSLNPPELHLGITEVDGEAYELLDYLQEATGSEMKAMKIYAELLVEERRNMLDYFEKHFR